MAKGHIHDRFNFILGLSCSILLFINRLPLEFLGCFIGGWFFSTYWFSPDTDIMPKKRTSIFGIFLYPYSVFSKHRGLSHHILLGTLIRGCYSLGIVYVVLWLGEQYADWNYHPGNFISYLKNFNFEKSEYKMLIWFFLGMLGADLGHLLIDRLWSIFR